MVIVFSNFLNAPVLILFEVFNLNLANDQKKKISIVHLFVCFGGAVS